MESVESLQNFDAWVKQQRQQQGLTAGELSNRAAVDSGGLSRIESGRAEPTFAVAMRIIRALHIELRELIVALQGRHTLSALDPTLYPAPSTLTIDFILDFLDYFHANIDGGGALMDREFEAISDAVRVRGIRQSIAVGPGIIDVVLPDLRYHGQHDTDQESPFEVRFRYPSLDIAVIRDLYDSHNAIIVDDARQVTTALQDDIGFARLRPDMRRRLRYPGREAITLEKILLIDVLALDALLTPDGFIAGLWQQAVLMRIAVTRPWILGDERLHTGSPQYLELAECLVRIHRWKTLYGLGPLILQA